MCKLFIITLFISAGNIRAKFVGFDLYFCLQNILFQNITKIISIKLYIALAMMGNPQTFFVCLLLLL